MSDTDISAAENVQAFSPEQEQYIGKILEKQAEQLTAQLTSHFGRISKEQVKKTFEENKIDTDKINEELSAKLFGGDVTGTVEQIIEARERKKQELSEKKKQALEEEMEKFKDAPFFKETKQDIDSIAQQALEKGFPPGPAVEIAVEKAKANYLLNRDPEYKLSMSGAGKPTPRTKAAKLPAELKTQAQRDINDGIFKDEAEYISNLTPSIRAKYGL